MQKTREELQKLAQDRMIAGDFYSAIPGLITGLQKWGDHVTVLCDLASCYYMVNDYQNYRKFTLRLWDNFQICGSRLEISTYQSTVLGLGKLLEELGEYSKVLKLYDECCDLEINSRFSQKIMAQKLRVLSMFYPLREIDLLYVACEQLNIKGENTEIDLQGALIQADCIMLGVQQAYFRYLNWAKFAKLKDFEKRLLIFDLIFESLRLEQWQALPKSILDSFQYYQCDPFEQSMWDLYLYAQGHKPVHDFDFSRTESMTPMGAIRYLFLLQAVHTNTETKSAARKKLFSYLRTLGGASQKILIDYWKIDFDKVYLKFNETRLQCSHGTFAIEKKRNLVLLLEMFSKYPVLPTEDVIMSLFGLQQSESSYSRLKVFIGRTNKFLGGIIGSPSPFLLNKAELELNPKLQLIKV